MRADKGKTCAKPGETLPVGPVLRPT
jgi:hypothetical protein